jgi:hypothetical protein
MKINPLKKSAITDKSAGIGTVTREMVQERAIEIAIIDGRSRHNVLESDWEQARRELTGGPEIDPAEAKLETIPESEEWDPVPGSQGHKAFEAPSEDEDEDGLIDAAYLFEEDMEEAGHETMLESTEPPRRVRRWKHR